MQAEVQRLLATNPDLVAFLEVRHSLTAPTRPVARTHGRARSDRRRPLPSRSAPRARSSSSTSAKTSSSPRRGFKSTRSSTRSVRARGPARSPSTVSGSTALTFRPGLAPDPPDPLLSLVISCPWTLLISCPWTQSILSATPEGHADYAAMKEASAAMIQLVTALNERKRAVENAERLRVLQTSIDFGRDGVALAGPLVREATVMHLVVTRDHRVKVRKPIRLIVAGTTVRRACQQK